MASSIALTAVAILLPLSSLWASASVEGRLPRFTESEDSRCKLFGSFSSGPSSASSDHCNMPTISPRNLVICVEHSSIPSTRSHAKSNYDDIDAIMENDIRVERTYSVHSGRGRAGSLV